MIRGAYRLSPGARAELPVSLSEAVSIELGDGALALRADVSVEYCESDRVTCILDGRLHEPRALARALAPQARSAPELVALAYRSKGMAALSRLRGRFCALVWDRVERRGLLTCDPLASKCLYLWRGGGRLLFASGFAELLELLPSRPAPDTTTLALLLGGALAPLGATVVDGVRKLAPGEVVELSDAAAEIRRSWRPRYAGTLRASRAELAEGLRERLERAVARRLAPRRTGVILSGGLDSSIVAGLASRSVGPSQSLRTYSAVFPGAPFDEGPKVRELAAAVGLDARAFHVHPQGTLRTALEYTERWLMPLLGQAAVLDTLIVAAAARGGCEVVLDGQTGDEVLGFSPYLLADRLRRGRLLSALALIDAWPRRRAFGTQDRLHLLVQFGLKGAAPYRLGQLVRSSRTRRAGGPEWMLSEHRRRVAELDDMWAWKHVASGPRWWRYLADRLIYQPHRDQRLDYLQNRAVVAGVINESPIYDPDVIDYCLSLPPELAFDAAFTRPLAREAMRGILPEGVRLQREKANLTPFCFEALTGADERGIDHLLMAEELELGAFLDPAWVKSLWRAGRPRSAGESRHWGSLVWRLAAAELWLRSLADPAFPREMLARVELPRPAAAEVALSHPHLFPSCPAPSAPLPSPHRSIQRRGGEDEGR